ncbi:GAF domain-containing sensor histidine kinase [Roseisolibacter agri]|uniref:Oxygen sensor histidine kinase NreB n=1 Tax=Roseisolibacter agri TaxID=2014610 RepID=A0AA37Q577_9BACT|nr:GAF domain-containing sensor histidine kinase [Roseisolibacter agri]GLC24847.1 hypothetical protein rosag_13600 [Roseisolibacter agri]
MSPSASADAAPQLARVLAQVCAVLAADGGAVALADGARCACGREAGAYALATRVHGEGASIGVLEVARADGPPFTAGDATCLAALAEVAAIVVRGAEQVARERGRAERLALIAHVARLVTTDLQLDDLLQRAADATHELLGYENVAIAVIRPDDPDALRLRSFGGAYKQLILGEHRLPLSAGLMGAAARSRTVVCVDDATADPRYVATPGTAGAHAELAVPLLLGGRVLGVLNVERPAPFGADDVEALTIVGDQLAVAIDNARLHDAAQRAAVLEERHRLARELHDSVTQQLFTATLVAQALGTAYARDPDEGERRASMVLELTRGALAEMRALLAELRPAASGETSAPPPADAGLARLRHDGLVAALHAHAESGALGGLPVQIDADGYAPQDAPREEALYRIAREALHNVVKHAHAGHADVRLEVRAGVGRLVVRDDGIGFAAHEARGARRPAGYGLGLRSMRERAAEQGGALRVDSAPGRGTVVEVELPLDAEGTP